MHWWMLTVKSDENEQSALERKLNNMMGITEEWKEQDRIKMREQMELAGITNTAATQKRTVGKRTDV